MQSQSVLSRIIVKIRHGLVIQEILNILSKIGVTIAPYYVVLEGLSTDDLSHLEKGFGEYQFVFAGKNDMKAVTASRDWGPSEDKLIIRLNEGKKCLAVKFKGQIVAFTWIAMDEFDCKAKRFPLNKNEAYIFDAFTTKSFRGKGLAPFMRYRCYVELSKLGRERLYSVTTLFNRSSMRMKDKLNAQLLELNLYVKIFWRWHFNARIRKYRIGH